VIIKELDAHALRPSVVVLPELSLRPTGELIASLLNTEMLIGNLGRHPATRGTCQKSELDLVGLVDILDCSLVLADRRRNGI